MERESNMKVTDINPYIRYVNNYAPAYSYVENERIIYDYEFMYIMAGSAVLHYEGRIYRLKKGDLFYLRPNVKNHIVVEAANKLRMHCIHFDWLPLGEKYDFTAEEFYMHSALSENHREKEQLLRRRPNAEPEDLPIVPYNETLVFETYAPLFEKCYREYVTGSPASELRTKAAFLELVAMLMGEAVWGGSSAEIVHPRILQAIEYIRENYNRHLTVASLADKYGLSPKYFGKLFADATGKSFNTFVLEQRIFAAKEMLIGTDLKLEEIAAETGFGDTFYFSNRFKRAEGLAPSRYRVLMRGK